MTLVLCVAAKKRQESRLPHIPVEPQKGDADEVLASVMQAFKNQMNRLHNQEQLNMLDKDAALEDIQLSPAGGVFP